MNDVTRAVLHEVESVGCPSRVGDGAADHLGREGGHHLHAQRAHVHPRGSEPRELALRPVAVGDGEPAAAADAAVTLRPDLPDSGQADEGVGPGAGDAPGLTVHGAPRGGGASRAHRQEDADSGVVKRA